LDRSGRVDVAAAGCRKTDRGSSVGDSQRLLTVVKSFFGLVVRPPEMTCDESRVVHITGPLHRTPHVLHTLPTRHGGQVTTRIQGKRSTSVELFMGNLSHSYGASPAIWDRIVTCHPTQVNAPPP